MKIAHLVLPALFLASHYTNASVCQDIQTVTNSMQNNFDEWKGAYDQDLDEYSSTYALPGANECYITEGDDVSYYCQWLMGSESQANEALNNISNDIAGCDNIFTTRPSSRQFSHPTRETSTSRTSNSRSIVIYANDIGAEIRVSARTRLNKRNGMTRHIVSVSVDRTAP